MGLGRFVPKELRATLNLMFGLCSMAMGVSQIAGLSALAPLVLSIILGAGVGCAMHWERAIAKAAGKLRGPLNAILRSDGVAGVAQDEWMARYVAAVVLFCASGTGIYGAMQEGLSGDPSILVTKAVLDFFTAMILPATSASCCRSLPYCSWRCCLCSTPSQASSCRSRTRA